jgi:alkylhydroperoxidase family enzyme
VTWLPETATGADPLERVFGLRPNLFEAWREFALVFFEKRLLDPVLLELVRLRVAQLHAARYPLARRRPEARAAGLDEAKIAELERWWRSPAFTETERRCLAFAEQFVLDAKAMTDEQALPVVEALGEAGTVALAEALAVFDGFGRFCRILAIEESAGKAPKGPRSEPQASGVQRASAEGARSEPQASGVQRASAEGARSEAEPSGVHWAGARSEPQASGVHRTRGRVNAPRVKPPPRAGGDPISASALAHQPEALAAFSKLYGTLWSHGILDHPTKEIARIRNARTLDCGY